MTTLIILGVLGLFVILTYNGLIQKKNEVTNVFGSMDAMLKKRYDLIPNLIETVKQYMEHEKSTLTEVTEMRAKAVSGNMSDNEKVQLENKITKALGGIMVAVENYPDLKANTNFIQLQGSMNEVEEQISAARRTYNAVVTDYNNAIEMFPSNLVAKALNYQPKEVFEIPSEQRDNINAKDLFNN